MTDRTKKLALASLLTALTVVCMFALGMFTKISAYAVSAFIMCVIVAECGKRYAFISYAVTSVLLYLILPDIVTFLWYVLFAGIYPIIKNIAEMKNRTAEWIIKVVYGIVFLVALTGLIRILGINAVIKWYYYIAAVPVFVIFDIALSYAVNIYFERFRKYVIRN